MKDGEATEDARVDELLERIRKQGESSGYYLNRDQEFTRELCKGLIANERRYGYRSCPCRLATGSMAEDLDIICPCDYRDPDLSEYGACFCALYVSRAVFEGREEPKPVPERRPEPEKRGKGESPASRGGACALAYPVFRCRVCGYLCARDDPPENCPICKAGRERFERFL